ncbi:MAG: flagellar assembly protein A, partial [Planctomycetota bacterium]
MEGALEIPIPGFSRFEDLDLDHWVTLRTEADQDRRITIFADRHKIGAWAVVQATGKKPKVTAEDVVRVACSANIAVADESTVKTLVKSFLGSPKEPHKAALLAKGRAPKDGINSITEWATDNPLDEGDEDGEGLISGNSRRYVLVKKGDLIFEVTPPVHGEAGLDIFGKPVPCKDGEWNRLLAGEFTTSNQSQTEVVADHDGYLDVRDGRVNVNPTVVVIDVNHKTGNIEFDGEVWVQGEVQADYHVYCNKLRARTINRGHVKVAGHLDIEENFFGE